MHNSLTKNGFQALILDQFCYMDQNPNSERHCSEHIKLHKMEFNMLGPVFGQKNVRFVKILGKKKFVTYLSPIFQNKKDFPLSFKFFSKKYIRYTGISKYPDRIGIIIHFPALSL